MFDGLEMFLCRAMFLYNMLYFSITNPNVRSLYSALAAKVHTDVFCWNVHCHCFLAK